MRCDLVPTPSASCSQERAGQDTRPRQRSWVHAHGPKAARGITPAQSEMRHRPELRPGACQRLLEALRGAPRGAARSSSGTAQRSRGTAQRSRGTAQRWSGTALSWRGTAPVAGGAPRQSPELPGGAPQSFLVAQPRALWPHPPRAAQHHPPTASRPSAETGGSRTGRTDAWMENEDQRAPLPDAARRAQARTDLGRSPPDVALALATGAAAAASLLDASLRHPLLGLGLCGLPFGDASLGSPLSGTVPVDRPGGAGRSRPGRRKDEPCSSARRPGLEPTRQRAPGRRARSCQPRPQWPRRTAPSAVEPRPRRWIRRGAAVIPAGRSWSAGDCRGPARRTRLGRIVERLRSERARAARGARPRHPRPGAGSPPSGRPMPCRGAFASDSREQERATRWRCPDCTSDSWRRGSRSPRPCRQRAVVGAARARLCLRGAPRGDGAGRTRSLAPARGRDRAGSAAAALKARPGHPVPRPDGWAVLGLALAWQVPAEPGSVHAVGTQSSFTATAGLLRGATRLRDAGGQHPRGASDSACSSRATCWPLEPEPDGPRASRAFP